jgi:transcriptional regulator with XRE-family HTH domain
MQSMAVILEWQAILFNNKKNHCLGEAMVSLVNRIREARKLTGISRAELARQVGVKPSAAAQWEQTGGTAPSVRNLIRIATITDVSFEWLATGRGMLRPETRLETPAVTREDFAHNLFEEQMLLLARDMPVKWREPLVQFLRVALGMKA